MRYRRLSYRYTVVMRSRQPWPTGDPWSTERLRVLVETRWRPDTDVYETPATVEIVVDLAGVDEDDFELLLFEDAVVVEGHRRLSAGEVEAVYHAASIRQGPFRVEVSLPASIDAERVEARYDRGLLRVTLPKRGAVG